MSKFNEPKIDNLNVYTNSKTVEYYDQLTGLEPCENYVFSKYIAPNIEVLDIGVGGGRTTPYLSSDNRQYSGVDYSSAMTEVCRKKFPALSFHTLDASDLSFFENSKFDAVVFSFNGIDCLYPDEQRMKCLEQINGVLKADGMFIFSVHNARAFLIRPQLDSVDIARKIWRLLRTTKSFPLLFRQLCRKAFYKGVGYIIDPIHGGHLMHTSIPQFVKEELAKANFRVLEVVSSNYPVHSGEYTSPWYYYVAQKQ
ncbi:class I SAM-dependent methyltransferase [Crenothrix sp.]|uniref:class I SAM-dependent methyltransferase n=1 Tax=Crenothrix sp. TaxID=3100433 RepID=UPI00374D28AF